MKKTRVLYLSSIPLIDSTGGPVVMYNHLVASGDFDVFEVNDAIINDLLRETKSEKLTRRVTERLSVTRLAGLVHSYRHFFRVRSLPKSLQVRIRDFAPEVVITVAHGNLFPVAQRVAKCLDLPLVSVFHDYWPLLV
ncbi:MAG: hypothetical protein WBA12_14790, partial [Catalinimonas sp.]